MIKIDYDVELLGNNIRSAAEELKPLLGQFAEPVIPLSDLYIDPDMISLVIIETKDGEVKFTWYTDMNPGAEWLDLPSNMRPSENCYILFVDDLGWVGLGVFIDGSLIISSEPSSFLLSDLHEWKYS